MKGNLQSALSNGARSVSLLATMVRGKKEPADALAYIAVRRLSFVKSCTVKSVFLLLLICFPLAGRNRDRYRVVERADRFVDKQGRPVSDKWYDGLAYDHEEVIVVLKHGASLIHATCDVSTLDKLDPNASCGSRKDSLSTYFFNNPRLVTPTKL